MDIDEADFIPDDDDDEMFALLDEQFPQELEPSRRSSFSQKRLRFSSPARPDPLSLVDHERNSNMTNSSAPNQTNCHSNANDSNSAIDDEPDWNVDTDDHPPASCLSRLDENSTQIRTLYPDNDNPPKSCLAPSENVKTQLEMVSLDPPTSCLVSSDSINTSQQLRLFSQDRDHPPASCLVPSDDISANTNQGIFSQDHDGPLASCLVSSDEGNSSSQFQRLSSDVPVIPDIDLTGDQYSTRPPRPTAPAIPSVVDLCDDLDAQQPAMTDADAANSTARVSPGNCGLAERRGRYSVQSAPTFYSIFDDENADEFAAASRSLSALKRMPAHSNFVVMTSSLGGDETRLYLSRTPSEHYQARIQNLTRRWQRNLNRTQLLDESIETLLQRLENKRIAQLVEEEEASLVLAQSLKIDDLETSESASIGNKKRRLEDDKPSDLRDSMLFVDRFAPKTFLELLSDSRINREVLQWVQAWDPVVFHRAPRPRPKPSPKSSLSQSTKSPFKHGFRNSSFPNKKPRAAPWIPHNPGLERGPDQRPDDHRPFPRALLFAGPPGSGKTTLARCIARQAGYNIVEINASDDRSVSTLRSKIIRAISMDSVLTDGKPNLVILDEIDGVEDATAIRALIDIITDNGGSDSRRKSKKKSGSSIMLQRPIICICNDLYAKVLRPLRAVVLAYVFKEPTASALQQRFSHICLQTGLQMESAAFRFICDRSRNDIRSTLQVLQFVAANARSTGCFKVRQQDVLSVYDPKDLVLDHFAIWNAVFKQETKLNTVIDSVMSYKDSSRITDGLFEFYIKMSYSDPTMSKTCLVADCFSFMDNLTTAFIKNQNFFLSSYSGLTAGVVHQYCSVRHVPKMSLPKEAFQHSRDILESRDILSRCRSQSSLKYTEMSAVTEFFPALYHIVTPRTLRNESAMLSTQDERLMLRVTRLMQRYGLSFATISDTDKGQLRRNLQPDISRFCTYSAAEGEPFLYRLPLIWIERIARTLTVDSARSLSSRSQPEQPQPDSAEATSDLQPRKGWQGSFKQHAMNPHLQSTLPLVRFRYNEGFTQAVRRSVLISAFILSQSQ